MGCVTWNKMTTIFTVKSACKANKQNKIAVGASHLQKCAKNERGTRRFRRFCRCCSLWRATPPRYSPACQSDFFCLRSHSFWRIFFGCFCPLTVNANFLLIWGSAFSVPLVCPKGLKWPGFIGEHNTFQSVSNKDVFLMRPNVENKGHGICR